MGCDFLGLHAFLRTFLEEQCLEYFFCVCIASSKHLGAWQILEIY